MEIYGKSINSQPNHKNEKDVSEPLTRLFCSLQSPGKLDFQWGLERNKKIRELLLRATQKRFSDFSLRLVR